MRVGKSSRLHRSGSQPDSVDGFSAAFQGEQAFGDELPDLIIIDSEFIVTDNAMIQPKLRCKKRMLC